MSAGEQNGPAQFATTHWSIVAAAGRDSSAAKQRALATLCEAYWYPLYVYVRRRGHSADDAKDLTQEFFLFMLEKDSLQVADPERGRFRSFLLASLSNFLSNQWRRAGAAKRGGRRLAFSLDAEAGEDRYASEPQDDETPERVFQRRWAMTLLEKAVTRLQDEFERAGNVAQFQTLKAYLSPGGTGVPYKSIAAELEMTEGSVKVAVHRLRRRFRELLRDEIAQTVASRDEIEDELRELFAAVG